MKVGDYVRTKNGNIRKIKEVIDKYYLDDPDYYADKSLINIEQNRVEDTIYMEKWLFNEEIIKSSPNIIDLIEVGDYVNGLYVHGITDYGLEVYMFGDAKECLKEDEIKTIVTKEQFKNMEYEVE